MGAFFVFAKPGLCGRLLLAATPEPSGIGQRGPPGPFLFLFSALFSWIDDLQRIRDRRAARPDRTVAGAEDAARRLPSVPGRSGVAPVHRYTWSRPPHSP